MIATVASLSACAGTEKAVEVRTEAAPPAFVWSDEGETVELAAQDAPSSVEPSPREAEWVAFHRGLELSGSRIPRAGAPNRTLFATLAKSTEPHGAVVEFEDEDFVRGRVSHFGGPHDTSIGERDTGAITQERVRRLNNPLDPSPERLADRPEDYYYAAMRFDYSPNGKPFWREARLLVVNPANGAAVVVRPIDWGPHTRTGRIVDLSPRSLEDLGLETDDQALVAFAAPDAPLGVVE